jgi:large subunit ribosomal protein L23
MSKRVLISPHLTEKSYQLQQDGKYTFVCSLKASKPEIRNAVENRFPGTIVTDVRTMVVPGKRRRQFRQGKMIEGRTSGYKKAIVTLDPDGEQIEISPDM